MAKPNGIISLSGKLGDLVFTRSKKGNYAKVKAAKPVKQTEASKKSSTDFGTATSAAARIRRAFSPLVAAYGDDTLINRLNRQMIAVLSSIPKKYAGDKKLAQGDVRLLQGFRFNAIKALETLVRKPPHLSLLPDGELEIGIPSSPVLHFISPLPNAGMASLSLMIFNMDLDHSRDQLLTLNPLIIPLAQDFCGANVKVKLELAGKRLLLIAMGIHYLHQNGIIGSKRARAAGIIFSAQLENGIEIPFEAEKVPSPAVKPGSAGIDWNVGPYTDG